MSEINAKTEKTDHLDYGPMGKYDDETKPICESCDSKTWVVSTGSDNKWEWTCTNCRCHWEPYIKTY